MSHDNGNERLARYIVSHQADLAPIARRGRNSGPGAILFAVDEERKTVQYGYLTDRTMEQVVKTVGMETQYRLMSVLCTLVGLVPVVAELHTKHDRLHYVVGQVSA